MIFQSKSILNLKKSNNMKNIEELHSERETIQTNFDLILEILSYIPKDILKNPNSTYLDPCCGSGKFLLTLALILDKEFEDVIPDKIERMKHIFEKQLFGVEIDYQQFIICKANFSWEMKSYYVNFENINYNIINSDFLENKNRINSMKFDVIIGNPPYNEESGSNEHSTKQKGGQNLSLTFIEKAFSLLKNENSIIAFVTPNHWFRQQDKGTAKKVKDKLFDEGNFIYANISSSEIEKKYFKNVGSTFTYWIWKNQKDKQHNIYCGDKRIDWDIKNQEFIPTNSDASYDDWLLLKNFKNENNQFECINWAREHIFNDNNFKENKTIIINRFLGFKEKDIFIWDQSRGLNTLPSEWYRYTFDTDQQAQQVLNKIYSSDMSDILKKIMSGNRVSSLIKTIPLLSVSN